MTERKYVKSTWKLLQKKSVKGHLVMRLSWLLGPARCVELSPSVHTVCERVNKPHGGRKWQRNDKHNIVYIRYMRETSPIKPDGCFVSISLAYCSSHGCDFTGAYMAISRQRFTPWHHLAMHCRAGTWYSQTTSCYCKNKAYICIISQNLQRLRGCASWSKLKTERTWKSAQRWWRTQKMRE